MGITSILFPSITPKITVMAVEQPFPSLNISPQHAPLSQTAEKRKLHSTCLWHIHHANLFPYVLAPPNKQKFLIFLYNRQGASQAQSTDGMLACMIRLKSGRAQLEEPTTSLLKHKLCCPWAKGRQTGSLIASVQKEPACMRALITGRLQDLQSQSNKAQNTYMQKEQQTFHPDESTMRKIFPTDSQLVSIHSLSISNGPPLSEKLS